MELEAKKRTMRTESVNSQRTARPLVSFCQMCFNQKHYVEQSLRSAFAQTYSPLEIVISDDASTDGSWEIIQRLVDEYQGPHKIVLNRNSVNLGMIGNWDKLCSLSSGELIFKGDGDDISLPHRVEVVVNDWLKCDKISVLISHSYIKIDMSGNKIGSVVLPFSGWDNRSVEDIYAGRPFFHPGTGSAYKRILFERFGSCTYKQAADDTVYVGRAVLTGRLRVIQDELVMYRVGSGTTTTAGFSDYRHSMIRGLKLGMHSQYQVLSDLEKVRDSLPPEEQSEFKRIFEKRLRHHELVLKLWTGKTFSERCEGYREACPGSIFSKHGYVSRILLLPLPLGNFLLQLPIFVKKIQRHFKILFDEKCVKTD
jgi:glycosyltransferase involved in cell wall biosynthesis